MRFLHTSDWHVGKTLKGRDRLEEQTAVLREIVQVAEDQQVDAVLIAGDLYESFAPSAAAQALVVNTLLRLRRTGAEVLAIAGNHDHAGTFDAYRPLMRQAGIRLAGTPRAAGNGGVVTFTARSTGEPVRVAVLPFLSQRWAVRAAHLVANTPAENVGEYDQMVRDVVGNLTAGFTEDHVNVVMSHLTITHGVMGGGERAAQSIFEYSVPAHIFPLEAHYVALGHLHRRQQMTAHCPVHYSGSPLAIDFGEQENTNVVCLIEATPSTPAKVTDIPIRSGRRLRTVSGTVEELAALTDDLQDDYLRVLLHEPTRAGLREQVSAVLPNALEVRIDPEFAAPAPGRPVMERGQRSPQDLFAQFCSDQAVEDERVGKLFAELHDDVSSAGTEG